MEEAPPVSLMGGTTNRHVGSRAGAKATQRAHGLAGMMLGSDAKAVMRGLSQPSAITSSGSGRANDLHLAPFPTSARMLLPVRRSNRNTCSADVTCGASRTGTDKLLLGDEVSRVAPATGEQNHNGD